MSEQEGLQPARRAELSNQEIEKAGASLFNSAYGQAKSNYYIDPKEMTKILDGAHNACDMREIAAAASKQRGSMDNFSLMFTTEVNRSLNQETLNITSLDARRSWPVYSYTMSPRCSPLEK